MTAEKVSVALLTRAAFGAGPAVTYAELAGLPTGLIEEVLARPVGCVREFTPMMLVQGDRRAAPRNADF
ncbi:hypothetical protein [Pseudoduganella namucuonensis]|uniref:Uncharacterized protein n=1 Tax=Pseudoduganella namucuonensis TaxID=1035707 RepID=A0A1I7FNS2_9BURK|nr:hypothetical protein [Pseudoduganella namucuonensis]SFU37821.1 hypothetical protein SAMN05216552_1002176 [Pseudoduganella namucuonensis]